MPGHFLVESPSLQLLDALQPQSLLVSPATAFLHTLGTPPWRASELMVVCVVECEVVLMLLCNELRAPKQGLLEPVAGKHSASSLECLGWGYMYLGRQVDDSRNHGLRMVAVVKVCEKLGNQPKRIVAVEVLMMLATLRAGLQNWSCCCCWHHLEHTPNWGPVQALLEAALLQPTRTLTELLAIVCEWSRLRELEGELH